MKNAYLHPLLVLLDSCKGTDLTVFAAHNKRFNSLTFFKVSENSNVSMHPFNRDHFFLVKETTETKRFLFLNYQKRNYRICAKVTFSKHLEYETAPEKLHVSVELCGNENISVFNETVMPGITAVFPNVKTVVVAMNEQSEWDYPRSSRLGMA